MCGVGGIFAFKKEAIEVNSEELHIIREKMQKRGPDAFGCFISDDKRIGLAHRRLSIIDLSEAGAQPMFTEDKQYVITFNGEIYNFQTLKTDLEKKGVQFRSHSDTEVLLKLYVQYGEKMLPLLRGMFAFAIWDSLEQTLFVARDQLGIKPLYYNFQNGVFRFASQVKALLAGGQIKTTPSAAGQAGFFLWGHIPEPFTLYNEIKSLPAGSYMKIHTGDASPAPVRFWNLSDVWSDAARNPISLSVADRREYLRGILKDSIQLHLIADVPVGVFLSAGLDSTTLAALASEENPNIQTITLGFKEYKNTANDETILANKVADLYGTCQEALWISQADFQEDLHKIVAAMDQPSIDGVNTYFVCKAAASAGLKVALSGVGGDELFAGYHHFKRIPQMANRRRQINRIPFAKPFIQNILFPILKKRIPLKARYFFNYTHSISSTYFLSRALTLPEQMNGSMDGNTFAKGLDELETLPKLLTDSKDLPNVHSQISLLEMKWYMRNQLLRDTDWASMAHSLEVRTPLVDIEVLKKIAPLYIGPNPPTKKEMASTPSIPLPDAILNKPKTGFSIPVSAWLLAKHPEYQSRGYAGWAKYLFDQFTD